jgi:hypothetical protein
MNPALLDILLGDFDPRELPGCVLYHDYTSNRNLIGGGLATSGLTLTRATEATYTDASGVLSTVALNAFAIGNRGLQIFGGATNLATYSQDFTHANWSRINATASADTLSAPDGTTSADTVTIDTANGEHVIQQVYTVVSGTIYTFSVHIKPGTHRYIRVQNGTGGFGNGYIDIDTTTMTVVNTANLNSYGIVALSNGWFRVHITDTATANSATGFMVAYLDTNGTTTVFTGNGTGTFHLWGAQLETGATATPYIPTSGASAARNADVIAINDVASWWNASGGNTVLIEFDVPQVLFTSPVYFAVSDGGAFDDCVYYSSQISGETLPSVRDGGAGQASITFPGIVATAGQRLRSAFTVATNDFRHAVNGVLYNQDTVGTVPNDIDQAWLAGWSGGNQCNSYIRQIAIFNRALTNAELQLISQR